MIVQAVVLAAGKGSRLGSPPKPLQRVAGVPLIVHVAGRLVRAGIRRLVVVVGPEPAAIGCVLRAALPAEIEIELAPNARWEDTQNGVSLFAAAPWITGPCALTMADHLFDPELVDRVIRAPADGCLLGIDRDETRCFDLADATKVSLAGDRVVSIGKTLARYDALDTGMFRITPELIQALAEIARGGDCSLSDGVQRLADQGRMGACDIGEARWLDVDTPAAREAAERWLRDPVDAAPTDDPAAVL